MLLALKNFFQSQFETLNGSARQDPEHLIQLATTALLIEISRSDARVSDEEKRTITALVRRIFDLTDAEVEELERQADNEANEAVSLYEFTHVLNEHLSRRERVHVVELLWRVAFADRKIDKYEDYYIRKIAELLHVSHRDFIKTKLSVTEPE